MARCSRLGNAAKASGQYPDEMYQYSGISERPIA